MYLIDTNVLSELRKGARTNAGVRAFWKQAAADAHFVAVQTIGELRAGVEAIRLRGDVVQAERLETWLQATTVEIADRILPFDTESAEVWGVLMARSPQNPVDKQIAAIALIHDLTVVTRNDDDFADTGARVTNPFT